MAQLLASVSQDKLLLHVRIAQDRSGHQLALQLIEGPLFLFSPLKSRRLLCQCDEGRGNVGVVLHESPVVARKSQERPYGLHSLGDGPLLHCLDLILLSGHAVRADPVPKEAHFLAEEMAFLRLELQIRLPNSLKD